jgi:hypothetical protein
MPYWDERVEAMAKHYPKVKWDKYHIDILTANFVLHPDWFDVVVGSNLFGDILSDLGPACTGTIGIAPSGNINPEGNFPSVFEPVHGSAPDIAGQGIANPIGMIWSGAMMLEHLGEKEAAAASIVAAIERTLGERTLRTKDLGGNADTTRAARRSHGRARLHHGRRPAAHQRARHLGAGRLQRPRRLHPHRLQRLRDRRRQPARRRRAPGQRPDPGLRPVHRSAARPRRHDRDEARGRPASASGRHTADDRVGRAVEKGETQGFMKVVVDAETQRRSWAPPSSASAATRRSTALLDTMYAKAPYTVLQRAVHIHPTVSEQAAPGDEGQQDRQQHHRQAEQDEPQQGKEPEVGPDRARRDDSRDRARNRAAGRHVDESSAWHQHAHDAECSAWRLRVAAAFLAEAERSAGCAMRRRAADPTALARRGVALGLSPAGAALVAAAAFLVDGRPGPPLGLMLRHAALFVAVGDMIGLAFLLVGVFRFVAARHSAPPVRWCRVRTDECRDGFHAGRPQTSM